MRDDAGAVTRTDGELGTLALDEVPRPAGGWWTAGARNTRASRIAPCG